MNDKKQIQLLKSAIDAYEAGEILEAKDMAIEFINNITDFETESEDLGDYPDTIHNQFDNMTGSMNL